MTKLEENMADIRLQLNLDLPEEKLLYDLLGWWRDRRHQPDIIKRALYELFGIALPVTPERAAEIRAKFGVGSNHTKDPVVEQVKAKVKRD